MFGPGSFFGEGGTLDRLKHRIHNTRIPIKDKRLLVLVQCLYFATPAIIGYGIMQMVLPDPEHVRKHMKPPSAEVVAEIEEQKRRIQMEMDAARGRRGS